MSRYSKLLMGVLVALFVVVGVMKAAVVYTDYLWFQEMGQASVFRTMWFTRVLVGALVGVIFFAWLYVNIRVARKLLPKDTVIGQRLLPDAERASIEQHIDKVLLLFALIGSIITAITAGSQWVQWLRYFNSVPFSKVDPLLGMDISFYIFKLPLIQYAWKTAFYSSVIVFVVSTLIHLYNESIRIHGRNIQATIQAQWHCLGLLAWCFLLKGVGYYLARFALMYEPTKAVPGGPGYAAAEYRLPVFSFQIGAVVLAAAICIACIKLKNLRLPAFALAGVIIFSILFGVSFPAVMEHLYVRPNALKLEAGYIAHSIKATNEAHKLDVVVQEAHDVADDLTLEDTQRDSETIKNLPIWDDRPLEQTYRRQQAMRQYYEFPRAALDRYRIDGELRQVAIAARQLDYDKVDDQWPNRHLQYTHGYGVCMSPVNQVDSEGLPQYWVRDFPPKRVGEAADEEHLRIDQPGIYFMENVAWDPYGYPGSRGAPPPAPDPQSGPPGGPGEAAEEPAPPARDQRASRRDQNPLTQMGLKDDYVIVNSGTEEIDYPAGTEGADYTEKTTYTGDAGVPIRSLFRRLAFFIRFRDVPILFYQLGADSRIIYNRWLPERIYALAPGLISPDMQPYPVIHEGNIVWMIDAYTFAHRYPYSQPFNHNAPNYIRNSVKITVDAYDGTTNLYTWDPDDPIIQVYGKIFPTLFKPKEEMPQGLVEHVRYPRFLFDIQNRQYRNYHVDDPVTFFQGVDSWAVPVETLIDSELEVEPYYVMMKMPGSDEAEFVLIRPYTPITREKDNMIAWMAARCDPEHYGELKVFRFPRDELSYGPMQIEARISQNDQLADYFRLKSQTNRIIRGHLLVIPVGDALMYVEPIYLESKLHAVPQLDRVVVASAKRLAYGPTLAVAIERLFSDESPTDVAPEDPTDAPGVAPTAPTAGGTAAEISAQLNAKWLEAEAKRNSGDFGGYQQAVNEIGALIEQLERASTE